MTLGRYFWIYASWMLVPLALELAYAEVPDALEPEYSDAVLSLNQGNLEKSLKTLDALIAKNPQVAEFFALRGLAFKSLGKDLEAIRAYQDTLQIKRKAGVPYAELAPQYFEMGVLYSKLKKYDLSNDCLNFSLRSGFNPGPSSMYLGINALQAGQWGQAEQYFRNVVSTGGRDLAPSGYLFLGQTFLKMEYPSGATQSFVRARDLARTTLRDPEADAATKKLAQQNLEAALGALKPYDRAQFFGTLATVLSYDSNVLTIPSSVASSAQTGGKGSGTGALSLGVGYISSSLHTLQFVPSYRAAINKNTNSKTRSGEFATNTLSLYLNVNPLNQTTYGMRLEGNFNFRDEVDTSTDKGTFKKFLSSGSFGPYIKTEIARRMTLSLDTSIDPTTYYQDDYLSEDSKRSGTYWSLTPSWQYETGTRFFNPLATVRYTKENTKGRDYRSSGYRVSISDTLHVNQRLDVTPQLSYSATSYPDRSSATRDDKTTDFQLQASYKWKPRLSLIGSLGYTKNSSTIPATYEYARFVVSAGANLSLF